MTSRGSDKSAAAEDRRRPGLAPSTRDRRPSRAPLRPVRPGADAGAARADRPRAAVADSWPASCPKSPSRHPICSATAGHRGRRRGPSTPTSPRWPRCSTTRPTPRCWWSGTHSAARWQCIWPRPDRTGWRRLLLLDPAVGLDGGWMREIADAMLSSPDYPDAAEARMEKAHRLLGGCGPRAARRRDSTST